MNLKNKLLTDLEVFTRWQGLILFFLIPGVTPGTSASTV